MNDLKMSEWIRVAGLLNETTEELLAILSHHHATERENLAPERTISQRRCFVLNICPLCFQTNWEGHFGTLRDNLGVVNEA